MDKKPFKRVSDKIAAFAGDGLHEKIFLASVCLTLILYGIGMTRFEITSYPVLWGVSRILRYLLMAVMIFNAFFVCGEYTVKEMLIIALVGCCLVYGSVKAVDRALLISMVIIVSAKNVSFEKTCRVFFFTYSVMTLTVMALFFTGFLDEFTMVRGEEMIRHSLGFNHPNLLGLFVFVSYLGFSLGFPEKTKNILFYLAGLALTAFLWTVPNSRTSAFGVILIMAAVPFGRSRIVRSRLCRITALIIPGLLTAVSIVSIFIYDETNRVFYILNKLFTSRLSLAAIHYRQAGWGGLWGAEHLQIQTEILIDNCYDRLFLYFGLIALVVFIAAYYSAMLRCIREERYDILVILVVMSVFGVFELYTFNSLYNIGLSALTACISKRANEGTAGQSPFSGS